MKQILLVNDVVGYSKVGMVAMLPILSYLGIPTYSLPTALVSNTLDYGKFNIQDTTDYIRGTLPVWKELGFSFDAICTGLMFSDEQAKLVAGYCEEQGAQGTTIFVDPILGDGGRLYNGMTERQVELMREMVSVADLTFPNYTEACYLTGTPIKMGCGLQPHGQPVLPFGVSRDSRSFSWYWRYLLSCAHRPSVEWGIITHQHTHGYGHRVPHD